MQLDQLKRRDFITLLGGAAAWPLATRAQQAGEHMRRVGLLIAMTTARSYTGCPRRCPRSRFALTYYCNHCGGCDDPAPVERPAVHSFLRRVDIRVGRSDSDTATYEFAIRGGPCSGCHIRKPHRREPSSDVSARTRPLRALTLSRAQKELRAPWATSSWRSVRVIRVCRF